MNARGIPPAAKQVLAMLICLGGGVPHLRVGGNPRYPPHPDLARVPPQPEMGYPPTSDLRWGTPPDLAGVPPTLGWGTPLDLGLGTPQTWPGYPPRPGWGTPQTWDGVPPSPHLRPEMGYPPQPEMRYPPPPHCGQTHRQESKHYLPVVLRTRAVKIKIHLWVGNTSILDFRWIASLHGHGACWSAVLFQGISTMVPHLFYLMG